jgi:hypothetical protein
VATTRRAMRTIESAKADPELVASLLSAKSDSEASVAFSLLRYCISDRELVEIVNLREVLRQLPTKSFRTGESLELLQRAGGYEFTGRSYRRAFDGSGGVFGVEFLGQDHSCRAVLIHTPNGRIPLAGNHSSTVEESLLPLLVHHAILLDAILEALELLGCPLGPKIYVTADDFLAEHEADSVRETLGGLF